MQLAGKIDWEFIDGEIAPLYSDGGRPGIATQFVIGLFLLKHIYGLSDEGVCERWVYDPYFQHFTGEEFFQHEFPHERRSAKVRIGWEPTLNFTRPRGRTRLSGGTPY